jgi:hypothetical protein
MSSMRDKDLSTFAVLILTISLETNADCTMPGSRTHRGLVRTVHLRLLQEVDLGFGNDPCIDATVHGT